MALAVARAWLIGTAKPWFSDDVSADPCEDAAVSMPMTWPEALTNDPPESPGWMLALTSISPDSCSLVPPSSSPAVIDWLSAVIDPPALVGVPPLPPALPTATTGSPTAALEEPPSLAVGHRDAPCSGSTARSWDGS